MDDIPELRNEIIKGIVSTPYIHTLESIRNKTCDESFYNKMMKECHFFKISHKFDYYETAEDGSPTYWGHFTHQIKKSSEGIVSHGE